MKELQAYEVIQLILKEKDTCSIHDIIVFKETYEKEHDGVYVNVCNNDIWYASEYYMTEFFWDEKKEVFIKQEYLICPICGDKYYKYPENERYNRILNYMYK